MLMCKRDASAVGDPAVGFLLDLVRKAWHVFLAVHDGRVDCVSCGRMTVLRSMAAIMYVCFGKIGKIVRLSVSW